jgi:hypothetical protein
MSYGSFQNLVAGSNPALVPAVGMGATMIMWTDREPFTIIEVRNNSKGVAVELVLQADTYTRTDKNGMSESQNYEFTPNPQGHTEIVTRRKNGQWVRKGESIKGTKFTIGYRDRYHDYSF